MQLAFLTLSPPIKEEEESLLLVMVNEAVPIFSKLEKTSLVGALTATDAVKGEVFSSFEKMGTAYLVMYALSSVM